MTTSPDVDQPETDPGLQVSGGWAQFRQFFSTVLTGVTIDLNCRT